MREAADCNKQINLSNFHENGNLLLFGKSVLWIWIKVGEQRKTEETSFLKEIASDYMMW